MPDACTKALWGVHIQLRCTQQLFVCGGDSQDSKAHMWAQRICESPSQAFVYMDTDPLAVILSKDCGSIRSFMSEQR